MAIVNIFESMMCAHLPLIRLQRFQAPALNVFKYFS